jgi:hypothetical protein
MGASPNAGCPQPNSGARLKTNEMMIDGISVLRPWSGNSGIPVLENVSLTNLGFDPLRTRGFSCTA